MELHTLLPISQRPLPRPSTPRRALRAIDVAALAERLAQFEQNLDPPPPSAATAPWQGKLWTRRPLPEHHLDQVTTVEKGHGRLETRTLEWSCALNGYVDWPGVGQVLRRTCQRIRRKTGEVQEEVTYGMSSLGWQEAGAAQVEALWRGHWVIENKVHYVRDVTLGKDAGQVRVGQAPQALAALRNGLLPLLRSIGVTNIVDAIRHYAASVPETLALIGVPL